MATYKNGRYFCTMNTCKSTQRPSRRGSKEYKQKIQITSNEVERYTEKCKLKSQSHYILRFMTWITENH